MPPPPPPKVQVRRSISRTPETAGVPAHLASTGYGVDRRERIGSPSGPSPANSSRSLVNRKLPTGDGLPLTEGRASSGAGSPASASDRHRPAIRARSCRLAFRSPWQARPLLALPSIGAASASRKGARDARQAGCDGVRSVLDGRSGRGRMPATGWVLEEAGEETLATVIATLRPDRPALPRCGGLVPMAWVPAGVSALVVRLTWKR